MSAGTVLLQLAAVFALVLANGFFVASEFALVSVRKTRIDQLAAEGNASAVAVQRALRQINRYIAATQVGISIVSLVLGGLGEQTLEPIIRPFFAAMPPHFFGLTAVGLATFLAYFVITTMHVVLGELLPKSITLQKTEKAALLLVRPMTWFAQLATPLVWMLTHLGGFLLSLLGMRGADEHSQVHSPEELLAIGRYSYEGGEINKTEYEMLSRVVRFSDTTARDVMVPRVEMQSLPLETSPTALRQYLRQRPHTRTPVYRGTLDDIVGIAHIKELVIFESSLPQELMDDAVLGDSPIPEPRLVNLTSVVREAPRVPETITIDRLLLEFKRRRQQMAIVIDEYGGTSGVVTMGDLLEQVFGDVHDEFDRPHPDIVDDGHGGVHIAGRVAIEAVNERFGLGLRSDESNTMGGLVFHALGRPAVVGDEVDIDGVHLRVEDVNRLRITRLLLKLPANRDGPLATPS